jgi:phage tail sheath gpL-like
MSTLFNSIPGSGLVAPIFTAEFNSGGAYSVSTRLILIAPKTAAGTLALNTPLPVPFGAQQLVDTLAGPGSMLREGYRVACQNVTAGPQCWLIAIDDSSLTAAVWTLTVGSSIAAGVGTFEIAGETIQINVQTTDTGTTIAAAIAGLINSYYNPLTNAMLPVTATAAGSTVTITARNKGAAANEIDFFVNPRITNNVLAASGAWTLSVATAGSGYPSAAAALAALGDDPADFVWCPFSDATSLSNYTAWASDVSGRWAWNRQSYGHVWAAAVNSFSGLTTLGLGLNDRHTTVLGCVSPGSNGTPHASWLWSAALVARSCVWLSDITTGNVSRAQKGLVLYGIRPPRDRSVWPNYSARNTLLQSGISTWRVGADGTVQIDKTITTYRTGPSGQPDAVFRDVQAMYQLSGGMTFLRAFLSTMFGQRALAPSNPGNLGAIATPSDIKAGIINGYATLCNYGVFADSATFASLVSVAINPTNANRVDAFMPMERVNPLDILAMNATIYQQYPQALAAA